MSEILEQFRADALWDENANLPLFPKFNNPWIYAAYALKLMRANQLLPSEEMTLIHRFEAHANECRLEPGLFNRWPGGRGGVTSHDELMGMAYISPKLAAEILDYLERMDGVYCNIASEIRDENYSDRFNLYRFPFLKPFLQACTEKRRVGFHSQIVWSAAVIRDAFAFQRGNVTDAGGRLRIWIMLDAMKKHPVSGLSVLAWKTAMRSKDCRLRDMLAREPGDTYPLVAEVAPEDF